MCMVFISFKIISIFRNNFLLNNYITIAMGLILRLIYFHHFIYQENSILWHELIA